MQRIIAISRCCISATRSLQAQEVPSSTLLFFSQCGGADICALWGGRTGRRSRVRCARRAARVEGLGHRGRGTGGGEPRSFRSGLLFVRRSPRLATDRDATATASSATATPTYMPRTAGYGTSPALPPRRVGEGEKACHRKQSLEGSPMGWARQGRGMGQPRRTTRSRWSVGIDAHICSSRANR